jgi:DNA-binding transcriptional LysR family regulator
MLVVLLEEENVTRAAARLHLSVPAASRALDRARHVFADPLLVRHGRGVVMTPLARELLPRLAAVVADISGVLERSAVLDPSTLRRTFVIRSNEAVIAALGAPLLEIIRLEAPMVDLRFDVEAADDMAAISSGNVALGIGSYSDRTNDVESELLGPEQLVGVLRQGHPALARTITLRAFCRLDHVVVSRLGRRRNSVDSYLAEHAMSRNVTVVVPSFSAAMVLVAQSDLTTVAPKRMANAFAGAAGLTIFKLPLANTSVDISQLWHGRFTSDPAHQWLRSAVRRAAATLN